MYGSKARRSGRRLPGCWCLSLAALLLGAPVAAQETGTVSGRAVDDQTGQPIADALVRIQDTDISALTTEDGRFQLVGVPPGPQVLLLEHLAYGEHARPVAVSAGGQVALELQLAATALRLDEVVVEARSELEERRTSSGHSMNEVLRPAIDRASQMGLNLGQLLQAEMLGVRVRAGAFGPHSCVEYRGTAGGGACREVSVFLDGIPVTAPSILYSSIPIGDIERLEVLSPGQAGAIYGSSAGGGVLLIETRRGTRPDNPFGRPDEVLVWGFDWTQEAERYPWERVLASSLVGNALGVGVSLVAAQRCFEVRARGVLGVQSSRCNAVTTMFAGFVMLGLPSVAGSYAARWAGETARSRGRILPGLIMGTISAGAGYMLLVRGESADSGTATNLGAFVLTVATPTLLTFSDRLLRILR